VSGLVLSLFPGIGLIPAGETKERTMTEPTPEALALVNRCDHRERWYACRDCIAAALTAEAERVRGERDVAMEYRDRMIVFLSQQVEAQRGALTHWLGWWDAGGTVEVGEQIAHDTRALLDEHRF
jgi:hypothetical protein